MLAEMQEDRSAIGGWPASQADGMQASAKDFDGEWSYEDMPEVGTDGT